MKKNLVYILICLAFSLNLAAQNSAKNAKKAAGKKAYTVVIDAGHGGNDPGAVGKTSQEKKLNLDVTLQLAGLIRQYYPDVKVVLTRSTDVFLTLQQRADIVNKNNADLFICIHTNSAENRNAAGAETFVLGIDKMQSNLDVAMRENAVMLLEDDYQTAYEGFDPNSIDSYIMFELMQDQYIDNSLQFATAVQTNFVDQLHRADRGVRQAGFWVLHKSACPSVLVEMGFISNREEEKYLASEKGRTEITNAIFDAFVSYKAMVDRRAGLEPRIINRAAPETATSTTPTASSASKTLDASSASKTPDASSASESPSAQETSEASDSTDELASRPIYRVQIFSTKSALPKNDPTFRGLKNCQYTKDGAYYKYTYGEDTDYETIVDIQQELKAKFKDCFIVAFLDGKQIPVKQARAMK